MKIEVEVSEEQVKLLKQFATNQSEEAKDNLATYKPLHRVETMVVEIYPFSEELNEYIGGDIVFSKFDSGNWFNSATTFLKDYFLRTKEQGMQDEIPPLVEPHIGEDFLNYEEYFKHYGLEEGEYRIGIKIRRYVPVSYHFTLVEARKYMKYQAHNLTNPRTYTFSAGYSNQGDYEAFWDLLMSIGTQLNNITKSTEERTRR